MNTLWLLMLVLVCPLMMIFMMRGMGNGGHDNTAAGPHDAAIPRDAPDTRDVRLAELEREVAELRAARVAETDRPDLSRR